MSLSLEAAALNAAGEGATRNDALLALLTELEGVVVLKVGIDEFGQVREAFVLESVVGLDEAALEALQERSYEPGRFHGRRVAVVFEVMVTFWPDGPPEIEDESAATQKPGG